MIRSAIRSVADGAERLFEGALISYWSKRRPMEVPPRRWSPAPSDNLQRAMNLVMPLRDPSPVGVATLAGALAARNDELMAGLNNVGNVHFARFDLIDGKLCMFSVYDGDFSNYIRDFIVAIGGIFDLIMANVKDPPPTPVEQHTEEFIEWVEAHDIFQLPSNSVNLGGTLEELPRELVLLLHEERNVMLGLYHCYPGFSTAQIRNALGVGW